MMKLRVAVCDDDNSALDIISASVNTAFMKRGISVDIQKFTNCKEVKRKIEKVEFDLLILDIETPYLDGISFGNELRDKGNKVNIIYVSNREELVFDALHVNPNGFVRKNHFLKDISATLDSFISSYMEKKEDILVIEERGQLVSIQVSQIEYIEGSRKNQLVYMINKESPLCLSQTMQKLEEFLLPKGFLRIHKGYIVNYNYIYMIYEEELMLKSKKRLPVSRRRTKDIKEKYLKLMQENGAMTI